MKMNQIRWKSVSYHGFAGKKKRNESRVCQQASIDNADAYTFRTI